MNNITFIFVVLCILIVPGVCFGIYWYFATKMGRNSLSLFVISLAMLILIITLVLWLFTRSSWLLVFGLLTAILQVLAAFSWRYTSPKIINALKKRE